MARFKAGQKIKQVVGERNIGAIAVVLNPCSRGCASEPEFCSMYVRAESAMYTSGLGFRPAGVEGWTNPDWWEPLTQTHEPASTAFTEALNSGDLSSWLAKERVT